MQMVCAGLLLHVLQECSACRLTLKLLGRQHPASVVGCRPHVLPWKGRRWLLIARCSGPHAQLNLKLMPRSSNEISVRKHRDLMWFAKALV